MRFAFLRLFFSRLWLFVTLTLTLSGLNTVSAQTPEQDRIARYRAIQMIEEGESLIDQGNSLLARRPTHLNPNQDMKPIHDRGRKMVDEGKAKVADGNAIIQELDERVNRERQERQGSLQNKEIFCAPIPVLTTEDGMTQLFEYLSKELPGKIEQRIFFHKTFYNNEGNYSEFGTLDNWLEIQLSGLAENASHISVLPEVEWIVNHDNPLGAIHHERLEPFKATKSAALTIVEIINWEDSPWLVINLTTSEIEEWTVLDQKTWFLRKDREARQWFGVNEVSNDDQDARMHSRITDSLAFLDFVSSRNGDFIHRLDNGRGNPYRADLHFWQVLVKQSLLENNVPLSNYDLVKRVFFNKARPFNIADQRAQASLVIDVKGQSVATNGNEVLPSVSLESRDHSTQRSVGWGTATLLPVIEAIEEVAAQ